MLKRVCILLVFLSPLAATAAQNVTIKGKDFYLGGKPWLPKGVNAEGFIRPALIPSGPKWMNDAASQQGRTLWSDQGIGGGEVGVRQECHPLQHQPGCSGPSIVHLRSEVSG